MKKANLLKNMGRFFFPALFFIFQAPGLAAQGRVVAQKPIDIVIQSAESLTLQVGSVGATIDVVRFDVSTLPGSGLVPGVSSGRNPVPVTARSKKLTNQMVMTVDSSIPLSDGAGHTIPFSELGWTGGGDLPDGTFSMMPNQLVFSTTAKRFDGNMAFYYMHTLYVTAGTYNGRVTFTLSSP